MKQYRSKGRTKGIGSKKLIYIIAVLIFAVYCIYSALSEEQADLSGKCGIHFIDVGQGDSTLFLCGENTVLIDAGPRDVSERTCDYISSKTGKIDYFIMTHPDEDHIGGAPEVIGNMKTENVIMTDAVKDTSIFNKTLDAVEKSGAKVIKASPGKTFTAGELKLTILAPIGSFEGDYNDYSIVTKAEYGETAVLVTGDAEHGTEGKMLEQYGKTLRSDVLKMGHHGSSTSSGTDFFSTVSPEIAVISCGKDNSYGHPHRETLKLLRDTKTEYYRTDEEGTIVLISDGKTVEKK